MTTDPPVNERPSIRGQRVLVAGATGYLGRHLVRALIDAGCTVRVLVRRPEQADAFPDDVEVFVGQVTDPSTLTGVTDGVDTVFSALGVTRQRGASYLDVDYRGNLALLRQAEQTGVTRFVYVSVLHGPELRATVRLAEAKERFVDELVASPVPSVVVRPTGYFSDMGEFLAMAGKGTVTLMGDGTSTINPISGRDVAVACIEAAGSSATDVPVGGPDTLSYEEIAGMAFAAHGTEPRIRHLPRGLMTAAVRVLSRCTPEHIHGPLQFLLAVLSHDMTAPEVGADHLADDFERHVAEARMAGTTDGPAARQGATR